MCRGFPQRGGRSAIGRLNRSAQQTVRGQHVEEFPRHVRAKARDLPMAQTDVLRVGAGQHNDAILRDSSMPATGEKPKNLRLLSAHHVGLGAHPGNKVDAHSPVVADVQCKEILGQAGSIQAHRHVGIRQLAPADGRGGHAGNDHRSSVQRSHVIPGHQAQLFTQETGEGFFPGCGVARSTA